MRGGSGFLWRSEEARLWTGQRIPADGSRAASSPSDSRCQPPPSSGAATWGTCTRTACAESYSQGRGKVLGRLRDLEVQRPCGGGRAQAADGRRRGVSSPLHCTWGTTGPSFSCTGHHSPNAGGASQLGVRSSGSVRIPKWICVRALVGLSLEEVGGGGWELYGNGGRGMTKMEGRVSRGV